MVSEVSVYGKIASYFQICESMKDEKRSPYGREEAQREEGRGQG